MQAQSAPPWIAASYHKRGTEKTATILRTRSSITPHVGSVKALFAPYFQERAQKQPSRHLPVSARSGSGQRQGNARQSGLPYDFYNPRDQGHAAGALHSHDLGDGLRLIPNALISPPLRGSNSWHTLCHSFSCHA